MSWNAFACYTDPVTKNQKTLINAFGDFEQQTKNLTLFSVPHFTAVIEYYNPQLGRLYLQFHAAYEFVKQVSYGKVDGLLVSGGLGLTDCRKLLDQVHPDHNTQRTWKRDDINTAYNSLTTLPTTSFDYDYEQYTYWSVQKFLEICNFYGLTIEFSY